MTQIMTMLVTDVSDEIRENLIDNHDKVCFPNFGDGDNI